MSRLTRPFGRPLHPIAASVALGCWAVSLGFDAVSYVSELPDIYVHGAYAATAFGVAAAIVASLIGLVDLLELDRAGAAFRTGVRHLLAMDAGLVLLAASFLVRRRAGFGGLDASPPAGTTLSVLGLIAVGIGLVHSGRLVYEHGVGRVERSDAHATAAR
jgi:uncharacterized membrane protein